jgi:hypothetical protein
MNSMAIELAQKALVLLGMRVEWWRSCPRLHQSRQAALMLTLLALLELLQLADRREELLQGPHCISPRKPSNSLQPLVCLQHLVRELSPARPAELGRKQPLEGLANTVGGRTSRLWEFTGRILSDKLPSSPQELDGILSPITKLGDQVVGPRPVNWCTRMSASS